MIAIGQTRKVDRVRKILKTKGRDFTPNHKPQYEHLALTALPITALPLSLGELRSLVKTQDSIPDGGSASPN